MERLVNLIRIFFVAIVGLTGSLTQAAGKTLPAEIPGMVAILAFLLGLTLLQVALAYLPWDPGFRYPLTFLDMVAVTGILCWLVATGRPLIATNSHVVFCGYFVALLFASLRGDRQLARDAAWVAPLGYGLVLSFAIGYGDVQSLPADPFYGVFHWDLQVLRLSLLVICGVVVVYASRLAEDERSASRLDPLTGVFNRRFLDEYLTMIVARARRARQTLSVLMIDVDGFKQFNDSNGHAAGDALLREIAISLAGAVREDNVVARYGGDEFVVVLPNTPGDVARTVAWELRKLFTGSITFSVGVASLGSQSVTKQQLLAKADEALFLAKSRHTGVEGCT